MQVYYIGKHGNDANDGETDETAFLTWGHALTQAAAQVPAINNRWALVCQDGGTYTENLTCVDWVDIHAPNAVLAGYIRLTNNVNVFFGEVQYDGASGGHAVDKSATWGGDTGPARFEAYTIRCTGAANAIQNDATGTLLTAWVKQILIENGFGVGSTTYHATLGGDIICDIGEISVAGNGVAVSSNRQFNILGCINRLKEYSGAATGIQADQGVVSLTVSEITCTTAYNVGASGTLRLFACNIVGVRTNTGTLRLILTGEVFTYTENEFVGVPLKATPVAGDRIVIEDSADGYSKAYATLGTLPGGTGVTEEQAALAGHTYFPEYC